jgi:hypothetical protein
MDPGGTFHLFPSLPTELRLKIWHHSFLARPRVVELHLWRYHYARVESDQWQSGSANPAALSASSESRREALRFYRVTVPLHGHDGARVLYINPAVDTVVVLGELQYRRLQNLFATVRSQDPDCKGLQRVGLSVACWAHDYAGATLRIWANTLFRFLDQFILLLYTERQPPGQFRGGECELVATEGESALEPYVRDTREFRNGDKWLIVGNNEMSVMSLRFLPGPASSSVA